MKKIVLILLLSFLTLRNAYACNSSTRQVSNYKQAAWFGIAVGGIGIGFYCFARGLFEASTWYAKHKLELEKPDLENLSNDCAK